MKEKRFSLLKDFCSNQHNDMGNYCQYVSTNFRHHNSTSTTNTSKEAGRITKYDNSARSSPNPKRDVKGNEMVGNALILKENRSMVLGAEEVIVETSTEVTEEDHRGLPKVILLPHQHTLFCERKVSHSFRLSSILVNCSV